MLKEPYILISGSGTIPAGVLKAGTVSNDTQRNDVIAGVGTAFLTDFKYADSAKNLWIYFVVTKLVRKVTGVYNDESLVLDRDVTIGAGETYHLVVGDNMAYSINNTSGSDIALDGLVAALVDTDVINEKQMPATVGRGYIYKDVKAFVVPSGSARLSENKG